MAIDDLEKLRQMVLADTTQQERLYSLDTRAEFIDEVVLLGHSLGYSITPEEVQEAIQAGVRTWLERWI